MAEALEQMLEPGERVLYQAPRLRVTRVQKAAYASALVVGGVALFVHSIWDWPTDWVADFISLVFFFMGVLGVALWQATYLEALVTDRRVLQTSGWQGNRIDEFTLSGIRSIRFMGYGRAKCVKVIGPLANQVIVLSPGRDAERVATTLAQAANLAPLKPLAFKVDRAAWLVHRAGDICGIAAFLGSALGLAIVAMGVGDPEPSIWAVAAFASLICLMFPAIVAGVIGGPLGSAVMMLCLRPFVSRDDMRAALDFKKDEAEGAWDSGFIVWNVRILERFARLLYGDPAQAEPEGQGHG